LRFQIGLLQQSSLRSPSYTPLVRGSHTLRFVAGAQRRWQSVQAQQQGAGSEGEEGSKQPIKSSGISTPAPEGSTTRNIKTPFYFGAGYAVFAKRRSRPFPPPFVSVPSGSFSDPLSTHDRSRDRRPTVDGEIIRGITNGDDAVLVSENFICADDGVGAWAQKEKGHAALWSRLIIHFWAIEAEKDGYGGDHDPNPVAYLQKAFEKTKEATAEPNEWFGTTTASSALLSDDHKEPPHPVIYATQLGDSQIMILRPRDREILYKSKEQWHWFDCPRQLGTNSPDTPQENAVMDRVEIEEDDVILAMSDGVIDNLWDHEVLENVVDSLHKWENGEAGQLQKGKEPADLSYSDRMMYVAEELVKAAKVIAQDPFAESPYMEKAVDEGLSIEGGKMDDISVVAAQCKRKKT
jgi:serine/threonine protein phosphatase PrpC